MGAFEMKDCFGPIERPELLLDGCGGAEFSDCDDYGDRKPVKDDAIIAYKVYDSCRKQKCLTARELGCAIGAKPDNDAVGVVMENLKIEKIEVLDKEPCKFREGYWEVTLEFTFEYELKYRDGHGKSCGKKDAAKSVYVMTVMLFGSIADDLVIGTDLYGGCRGEGMTFSSEPFVWTEAKALALDAKIKCQPGTDEVEVIIGLFCVINLVRPVHMNIQSRGFCYPRECKEEKDVKPCAFFEDLDFPIDLFAPPEKECR